MVYITVTNKHLTLCMISYTIKCTVFSLSSAQYALSQVSVTVHFGLSSVTVHCSLYSVTVQCCLYIVIVHCDLYSVTGHCGLYSVTVYCALKSATVHCGLYSVLCSVNTKMYSVVES